MDRIGVEALALIIFSDDSFTCSCKIAMVSDPRVTYLPKSTPVSSTGPLFFTGSRWFESYKKIMDQTKHGSS